MLYKPPKRSGFKFCSGFVVDRHTNSALPCMTQKGHALTVGKKLSHIFPHRDANIQTAFMGLVWDLYGTWADPKGWKRSEIPLDRRWPLTRNRQYLDITWP
jgi:hypothetical protein